MQPEIATLLTLISGISWSLVYIVLIRRGFADKTYGMPLFALSFNLSWEFLFAFVFRSSDVTVQGVVNIIWCLFDVVIAYTYFRYGRKEFAQIADGKWFLPWSITAFVISFAVIYVSVVVFGVSEGAEYTAFAQNLMMSVLFINLLVSRKDVSGQSIYVALLKWIGTAAPTILFYLRTENLLILVLGVGCFIYDALYTVMLYQQFRAEGLNPFTRKPLAAAPLS